MQAQLVKELEIFENQRWVPGARGHGFSCNHLMPTDRKAYSISDGSASWGGIEQAEAALTSPGWESLFSERGWIPDTNHRNTDDEGYAYDTDFGTFENAQGHKGMGSFVRRRRLIRFQDFQIERLFPQTSESGMIATGEISDDTGSVLAISRSTMPFLCDHCDHREIERIKGVLVQVLAAASLVSQSKALQPHALCALKSKMISNLNFCGEATAVSHVLGRLETFTSDNQSGWQKATMMLSGKKQPYTLDSLALRCSELLEAGFEESFELARAIIRKHDTSFSFHCSTRSCGSDCVFAHTCCPHSGCCVVYSKKWEAEHDAECPHKIVCCPRECGDSFPRRTTKLHMEQVCGLRRVECPFSAIGCSAALVHRGVPEHLDAAVQSHLLLAMASIHEQRDVINMLNNKVAQLEEQGGKQTAQLATLVASLGATTLAITESERRLYAKINEEVSHAEGRMNRKVSDVTSQTSQLQTSVRNIERAIKPR